MTWATESQREGKTTAFQPQLWCKGGQQTWSLKWLPCELLWITCFCIKDARAHHWRLSCCTLFLLTFTFLVLRVAVWKVMFQTDLDLFDMNPTTFSAWITKRNVGSLILHFLISYTVMIILITSWGYYEDMTRGTTSDMYMHMHLRNANCSTEKFLSGTDHESPLNLVRVSSLCF